MNAAMILCAGFGTRLHEYTKNIPKPMLPLSGKPLLEYTIEHLSRLGITKIVINLHYLPEKITSYFQDGSKWNVEIKYSYEKKPVGTAGAVKKAGGILKIFGDFIVLYGDVICNQNYIDLLEFHKSKPNAVASIILHQRTRSNSVVEMNSNNLIVRFIERPKSEVKDKKQNWVNSGLYCFNRKILDYIPKKVISDFPGDIFPTLVAERTLYGYPVKGYRCAVDSPERYKILQNDFKKKKIF